MSADVGSARPRVNTPRYLSVVTVGLGGMLGAQARYGIGIWVADHWGSSFPWGTLLVNASGSVLLGVLLTIIVGRERQGQGPLLRLFVATGLLGGYTTFSTFSYEAIHLLQDGQTVRAVAYVGASIAAGIAGVIGGMALARTR